MCSNKTGTLSRSGSAGLSDYREQFCQHSTFIYHSNLSCPEFLSNILIYFLKNQNVGLFKTDLSKKTADITTKHKHKNSSRAHYI